MAASTAASSPAAPGSADPLTRVLTSPVAFFAFAILFVPYNALGVVYLALWGRGDLWEHLAAIEAFARNLVAPANPYVAAPQATHLFTPWHLAWGLIVAATHISAYSLAPAMAAMNALLFVLALRLLAKRIAGSARWALPLGLAMLFLWYDVYQWSGFHNFGLIPATSALPFWCALPLAMMAIGTIDDARPVGARALLLRALIVALVFLIHPLGGSFLALVLAIQALTEPTLAPGARLVRMAALVAGVALSLAWPYFPVAQAIFAAPKYGSQNFAGDWRLFYDHFLHRILPACLGLLALVGVLRGRRLDWLDWTLVACAALYFSNPYLARSPLLSRYLIYLALVLQWSAVRWLAQDRAAFLPSWARAALFVLVLVPSAVLEARASLAWVRTPWSPPLPSGVADPSNAPNVRRFRAYAPYLGTHEVTMARMLESWVLPALDGSRVVGVKHGSPFMPDFDERRLAVERFFDPATRATQRDSLMTRYAVTRVLLFRGEAPRLEGVSAMPVLFTDDLYEIREAPPPAASR